MRAANWLLLISLAVAALSCSAEPAKTQVLIRNDGGGDILRYVAKYLSLQWRGERVVIDGDCFSACTLALGLLANDRRCFTTRARLGFHAAWEDLGSTRVPNPLGTAILWLDYPYEVRDWISRHGGLTSRVIYLEGKELAAIYPPCRTPARPLKSRS